ncbi:MAG: valine--tRNA ligase [Acidobacteria bacterium]|nr:valine--tRNA ligase [Acidobacteriota bacterium]
MAEIAKAYNPGEIEPRWASEWVEKGLYTADADSNRPMFSLVIPPPNVTGSLHMGHMLEHTLIDIIVRWKRMQGFNTLWLPGTDHAGIATQMVVERQLAEQGVKRRDLGREKFEEKVWEWKGQSGDTIKRQMLRLGASCDWSRERFTLDPGLSAAVREVFVTLYEKKLIYRGKYIVNWCPRCQTAISDLETVHEQEPGHLYHIRYPVIGSDEFVIVATTRPETMLGDTAVCVNPRDERYTKFHGKSVRLPLMNREIPFILDELADPEFGTGVVKVTPAHDANDFQAGLRHNLPQIDVMDETGRMNINAGAYADLDRYEARKRILEDLKQQGLLEKLEPHALPLGRCQRCKTPVEPRLSTQWFVKVAPLADAAIKAVEDGRTKFVPENYAKIYFEWMRNIHDWCISRQLWWGHRIPAWHCEGCNEVIVARETPAQCSQCGGSALRQDTDVLDTWFSSALWPFSTLGWPEQTRDLATFYPTSLLITGFDILFFWVARMMMMGIEFMGKVPFETVYIHQLVRDADKQKMSKTKGNVIDPLVVTEKYGTDAVRFTLAVMAAPGTDIALSEDRMEGYRAFANKIWNASRFLTMSLEKAGITEWTPPSNGDFRPVAASSAGDEEVSFEDRWIFSRLSRLAATTADAWNAFRFHDAAHEVYHFFWGEFCDWYLELKKLSFEADAGNPARLAASADNLCRALDLALRLLHPMMPFITEELWQRLAPRDGSISRAKYPAADPTWINEAAEQDMQLLQDIIVNIRNMRAEMKVDAKKKIPVQLRGRDDATNQAATRYRNAIERLSTVSALEVSNEPLAEAGGAVRSMPRYALRIALSDAVDPAAERIRLEKELQKLEKETISLANQLGNENFLAKAPAHIVAGMRKRSEEVSILITKITETLRTLN